MNELLWFVFLPHLIIIQVVQDFKYFQRIKWQYMILDEAQAIKSSSRWAGPAQYMHLLYMYMYMYL